MCTVLLPPGDNPFAVNKYIIYIIRAKLPKATNSFVESASPFVRFERLGSHWVNFHETGCFDCLSKIDRENSSFIQICKQWRVLFVKTSVHLWQYLVDFVVEWEVFQTKVVEKIKTHVLCSITLQESSVVYEITWKNIVEPTAYAHCVLAK